MKLIYFSIFFFIFFSKISFIKSSECVINKDLNIGILKNEYIDYEQYLYYELGNFSSNTGVSYNLEFIESNYEDFDIIFGEHYDLEKFKDQDLVLNYEILDFYKANNIEIVGNILPLDLDTFIILSKNRQKKLTLDELSNFYSPVQYSLGVNLIQKEQLIKLLIYNLRGSIIENNDISLEYILTLYSNIYENINNNIIGSTYLELVDSYDNFENIFTLFSDGILLNKNINYQYFQLFPNTKYIWNDEGGFYKKSIEERPISFFGFSAYINNKDSLGFICHLIDKNIRKNAFRNFNIQISPLSDKEVEGISLNIPKDYKEILINKNKNIYKYDRSEIENYKKIIKIINKQSKINEFINTDYLN